MFLAHPIVSTNSFSTCKLFYSYFRFSLDGKVILSVPDPLIPNNPEWTGFWEFGQPWFEGFENPWNEIYDVEKMAPFDKAVSNLL